MYLKTVYNPIEPISVYYKDSDVFAGNKYFLPIKIISFKNNTKTDMINVILKHKSSKSPIELTKISTSLSLDKKLKVLYSFIGRDTVYTEKVYNFYDNK